MPDTRGGQGSSGFRGAQTPQSRTGSPRPINLNECVPPNYPRYFTDAGFTRVELVQGEAMRIAECFKSAGLNRHQLRAFYDHAKRQLQRLDYGIPFDEVRIEIARLEAFAADRAGRSTNALPQVFKSFIDRNVKAVKDEKCFQKGFMPHFEAVVAYCATLRER